MSAYLKCKFPQNIQKSIKIKVVGAQFGAHLSNCVVSSIYDYLLTREYRDVFFLKIGLLIIITE